MAAQIWNSLGGYVIIRLEGLSLERLLNRMAEKRILVWNVSRQGRSMTACISARDFRRLHGVCRRLRVRVRIIEKHGAPFVYTRLRFRKVLLFGWLLGAICLIAASKYLWFIKVEGTDAVADSEVLAVLEQMEVRPGTQLSKLDTFSMGRMISSADPRIAWAGIEINGVVMNVTVIEAQSPKRQTGQREPCSLYALRDGVVIDVTALKGRPLVVAGDTVRMGDELVTGELTSEAGIQHRVHSEGSVTARTVYHVTAEQPATELALSRTGAALEVREASVFGLKLFGTDIPYEHSEQGRCSKTLIGGAMLPIALETSTAFELKMQSTPLGEEKVKLAAITRAQKKAEAVLPREAVIVSKTSGAKLREDGSAYAWVTLEVIEDIAVEGEIIPKEINIQEDS